jgi:hypothetical protein
VSGLLTGLIGNALVSSAQEVTAARSTTPITDTAGLAKGAPGRPLTGRVLSAADAKPLAGVRLTLAGQSATTDATGAFLFAQPPSGYQLVKIDQVSIESHRKPLKDGTVGGHMHADPVLVNISSQHANELHDPIYVVQTHPAVYTIAPGARADIRPTHIPGFKLSIPEGTTIKAEDGQPQSQVSITPVRPDRVPRIPDGAAPRTVYLVSFEKHGGGVPTKPVPVTMPNDLGADPWQQNRILVLR